MGSVEASSATTPISPPVPTKCSTPFGPTATTCRTSPGSMGLSLSLRQSTTRTSPSRPTISKHIARHPPRSATTVITKKALHSERFLFFPPACLLLIDVSLNIPRGNELQRDVQDHSACRGLEDLEGSLVV